MKKLSVLTLLLLMATFAFANNNEHETNEVKTLKTTDEPQTPPQKIYRGEKVGIFRPCKGDVIAICKIVIYSQTERDKVIVTDGETTIVVDANQVNFKDGSVEM